MYPHGSAPSPSSAIPQRFPQHPSRANRRALGSALPIHQRPSDSKERKKYKCEAQLAPLMERSFNRVNVEFGLLPARIGGAAAGSGRTAGAKPIRLEPSGDVPRPNGSISPEFQRCAQTERKSTRQSHPARVAAAARWKWIKRRGWRGSGREASRGGAAQGHTDRRSAPSLTEHLHTATP